MFVSRGIFLMLAYRSIRKEVPQLTLRAPDAKGAMDTLRRVWTYGTEAILILAWSHLDIVAVRTLFGTEVAGTYSAGQKIVVGLGAVTAVVGNVMIPRLSKLAESLDVQFWKATRNAILTMSAIGAVIALPFIAVPEFLVETLYGLEFQGLIQLMPFFGLIVFVRYTNVAAGAAAVAAGLFRTRVFAPLSGLVTTGLLLPVIAQVSLVPISFMLIYILGISVMTTSNIWSLMRLWAVRRYS
jgi:O-antigen/teichoic acid export membrane protein